MRYWLRRSNENAAGCMYPLFNPARGIPKIDLKFVNGGFSPHIPRSSGCARIMRTLAVARSLAGAIATSTKFAILLA
jgi:hypothetical protein